MWKYTTENEQPDTKNDVTWKRNFHNFRASEGIFGVHLEDHPN